MEAHCDFQKALFSYCFCFFRIGGPFYDYYYIIVSLFAIVYVFHERKELHGARGCTPANRMLPS